MKLLIITIVFILAYNFASADMDIVYSIPVRNSNTHLISNHSLLTKAKYDLMLELLDSLMNYYNFDKRCDIILSNNYCDSFKSKYKFLVEDEITDTLNNSKSPIVKLYTSFYDLNYIDILKLYEYLIIYHPYKDTKDLNYNSVIYQKYITDIKGIDSSKIESIINAEQSQALKYILSKKYKFTINDNYCKNDLKSIFKSNYCSIFWINGIFHISGHRRKTKHFEEKDSVILELSTITNLHNINDYWSIIFDEDNKFYSIEYLNFIDFPNVSSQFTINLNDSISWQHDCTEMELISLDKFTVFIKKWFYTTKTLITEYGKRGNHYKIILFNRFTKKLEELF